MKQAQPKHRLSFSVDSLIAISRALDNSTDDGAIDALLTVQTKLLEINVGKAIPSYITKEKITIADKLGFTEDHVVIPTVPIIQLGMNKIQAAREKRKLLWEKFSSGKQCSPEEYMEAMTYGMESGLLTPEQLEKFSNELMGVVETGAEELEKKWSIES